MIFDEKVVQECFCYMLQTNKRFVGAGTDDTVQVKILGQSQNATDWKILDQFFLNDFEAGSTQEYTVSHEGSPVGVPVMISFRKISSIVYQCCSSYGKNLDVAHMCLIIIMQEKCRIICLPASGLLKG